MLKTHIPKLDALLWWGPARAYLFAGDKYVRYDPSAEKAESSYPRLISSAWKGMKFTDHVDAAVNWNSGRTYFFRGNQYIRYRNGDGEADAGYPRPISSAWKGMSFTDRVDAAVNWGDGKAYFFRDDLCIRYDIEKAHADTGYPRPISAVLPGMPFSKGVDAAVNFNKGKIYFFQGARYVRYDIASQRIDPGYPKANDSAWKGVNFDELWHNGVSSVEIRRHIQNELRAASARNDTVAVLALRRMKEERSILELTKGAPEIVAFGKAHGLTTSLTTSCIIAGPDGPASPNGVEISTYGGAWKESHSSDDKNLGGYSTSTKASEHQPCEPLAVVVSIFIGAAMLELGTPLPIAVRAALTTMGPTNIACKAFLRVFE